MSSGQAPVPTPPPQKKAKISYENYIKKKSTDTVKISMMPPTGKGSTVVEFKIRILIGFKAILKSWVELLLADETRMMKQICLELF